MDRHVADVAGLLARVPPARRSLHDAVGCVLAEDVYSPVALPTFDSSAMDGYAVRVADVPGRLLVAGEVAAGSVPTLVVGPATAVRIMTGSMLPPGTEAVVPVEATDGGLDVVTVRAATAPGAFMRPAGSDLQLGGLVVSAGTRLGGRQIAALAAVGLLTPLVAPQIRVGVLSTGAELLPAGSPGRTAHLVDSNGPGLIAAATVAGATVVDGGFVGDEVDRFLAVLYDLAQASDLIITSGGVSVGAHDVVKAALLSGGGVAFERVAIQPGMPQAWGQLRDGTAFLGFPGNPVSALVSFELFGRAALGRTRPTRRATLAAPIVASPRGKRQFVAAVGAGDTVAPVGGTGSHQLSVLARASALIVVPEDVEALPAGCLVDVVSLDDQ